MKFVDVAAQFADMVVECFVDIAMVVFVVMFFMGMLHLLGPSHEFFSFVREASGVQVLGGATKMLDAFLMRHLVMFFAMVLVLVVIVNVMVVVIMNVMFVLAIFDQFSSPSGWASSFVKGSMEQGLRLFVVFAAK